MKDKQDNNTIVDEDFPKGAEGIAKGVGISSRACAVIGVTVPAPIKMIAKEA